MDKTKSAFIKIDEFIFQKLDILKNDPGFQKINELLFSLEEKQQKLFAQILTFSLIIIPYIFILVFWWGNSRLRFNQEIKMQILEQISTLNGNKDVKATVSSSYLAPIAILSQEDLDNKIRNLMSSNNIDQSKVRIANFTQASSSSSLSKIEATAVFQNFGTQDFSNFMRTLIDQEKFKILQINMTKDNNTKLLNGEVSLMHLGKSSPQ